MFLQRYLLRSFLHYQFPGVYSRASTPLSLLGSNLYMPYIPSISGSIYMLYTRKVVLRVEWRNSRILEDTICALAAFLVQFCRSHVEVSIHTYHALSWLSTHIPLEGSYQPLGSFNLQLQHFEAKKGIHI
jgi:hypothetical protein